MRFNTLTRVIIIPAIIISFSGILRGQDSLSLEQALEKSLEHNYGIRISRSEAKIAGINNNWGNAGRYPTIGFDIGSYNSYDINNSADYQSNRLSLSLGTRWTLFDGFRVKITKDKLAELEILAKGRSAVVVENSIQDVILAYYNVLLNQEQLMLFEKIMTLSKDRYDFEQRRYEIGGTASFSVLQAKNVFLNDTALFLEQEVRLRSAIRNMNFLIGEESSREWLFSDKFEVQEHDYLLSDLSDKMIADNKNLQNQYTDLILQQEEIKLKKGNYYPGIDLTTGVNNNWAMMDRLGSAPTFNNNMNLYGNLIISFDLYSGGNRNRALEVARVNEKIVLVETEQMKHSLNNQLLNLHDSYYVLKALKSVAEESLETAAINLDIAGEKFRAGAINSFNYRDIQLIYLNSALQNLKSVFNLIQSETSLIRITGGFVKEEVSSY